MHERQGLGHRRSGARLSQAVARAEVVLRKEKEHHRRLFDVCAYTRVEHVPLSNTEPGILVLFYYMQAQGRRGVQVRSPFTHSARVPRYP